jgi:hypothetical protein
MQSFVVALTAYDRIALATARNGSRAAEPAFVAEAPLAAKGWQLPDEAIEKSAMRKVYLRLLPFAILSYFLAYIDRINVSFAGLTMRSDLGQRWKELRGRPQFDFAGREFSTKLSTD